MGSHIVYIWSTCEIKINNKNTYTQVVKKQMYA